MCYSIQGSGIIDYGEDGIVTTDSGNIKESNIIGHEYFSIYLYPFK